ncbi:MAG: DUF1499 domain-containing protein [Cyanobacteria bacterium J06648_11]
MFSFSGQRPTNLGATDGTLAACPGTPNCVSSQSEDAQFQIDPLPLQGSAAESIQAIAAIVQGMELTEIVEQGDRYLYAEFTSKLMGFVDDVEFYADDAASVVHVRSASRLGKSDLGVNRKRVEEIRSRYA